MSLEQRAESLGLPAFSTYCGLHGAYGCGCASEIRRRASEDALRLVATAIRKAVEAEREECAKICESFAAERLASIERLINYRESDERLHWLDCKRTEAERCAKAIRARQMETSSG